MPLSILQSDPVNLLQNAVESFHPHLQPSGELHDPVFQAPTQYGTAYYAYCQAVLAQQTNHKEMQARAARSLDAALKHVEDLSQPATFSGFNPTHGAAYRSSHRDFFWPPILKSWRILSGLGHPQASEFGRRIENVDILTAFNSRPPSNWAAVWLSGEWLRKREGLSPFDLDQFDVWLDPFFDTHILLDRGFYCEPGHPNSYDLFTRLHLTGILAAGYDGRHRPALKMLMQTGLRRSLGIQLSDGSMASAFRSTGQTWTLGAQCTFFTLAAHHFQQSDPELSIQAATAAWRAVSSMARWQRPDGCYSPVENCLAPAMRVGYEGYTADAHYSSLALGFLAEAIASGLTDLEAPAAWDSPAEVFIEHDPTWRAVARRGQISAHLNLFPDLRYDSFGLVDLTFGPGRFLHFASSVKSVADGSLRNIGMGCRGLEDPGDLYVVGEHPHRLLGQIEALEGNRGLRFRSRPHGQPWVYDYELELTERGAMIQERTLGHIDYKSLLLPYLLDGGAGRRTTVTFSERGLDLVMGPEKIRVQVEEGIGRTIDLPHRFENRRGLCGLVRIDLAQKSESITYRIERLD